jgi:hypothetical protein
LRPFDDDVIDRCNLPVSRGASVRIRFATEAVDAATAPEAYDFICSGAADKAATSSRAPVICIKAVAIV